MNRQLMASRLTEVLSSNQFSVGRLRGQFGTNTDFMSRQKYHTNGIEAVQATPQMFLTYMGLQALKYIKHPQMRVRCSWVEEFTNSCLDDNMVKITAPFQSPERDDVVGDIAINYRHTAMAYCILIDSLSSADPARGVIDKLISNGVQTPSGGWPEWSIHKDSPSIIASVYIAHFLFKFHNKFPNATLQKPIRDLLLSTLDYLDQTRSGGVWQGGEDREASIRFYPTLYLLAYPVYLYYRGRMCPVIAEYPELVRRLCEDGRIRLTQGNKVFRTTLRYVLNLYFHSFFSSADRAFFEEYRGPILRDLPDQVTSLNAHEIFGACVLLDSTTHYEVPDNECFHILFENSRLIGSSLIEELHNIPAGHSRANDYHEKVLEIFNFVFHRVLESPQREQVMDEGRKRVDIVYFNSAKSGFFYDLSAKFNVPCPYVIVECKNYSQDIENPEYDQLCGRLSSGGGMFGIITCRSLLDKNKATQQRRAIVSKRNGYVIVLDDQDLTNLIELKIQAASGVDAYLERKMRELLL